LFVWLLISHSFSMKIKIFKGMACYFLPNLQRTYPDFRAFDPQSVRLYINIGHLTDDNFKILGSAKVIFLLTLARTIKFF
jgi:hypothetical protein